MLIRTALAGIDHNQNTDREQKVTAGGKPMFALLKQRHGKKYFVRVIKVEKDYGWRNTLASLTVKVG